MMLPSQLIDTGFHVDRAAIRRYADLSHDYNPIHLDPDFAARTPMGGVIAHGMLSMSLIWQSLAATFGSERMAGIELDVRFVKPVREGSWITAGGSRVADEAKYDVWVRAELDSGAETVIAGTATLGKKLGLDT
jgi:3-hydroxybutyryl-CoA dehydratase